MKKFKTVLISENAEELIQDNENGAIALGMAETPHENDRAYAHLCVTRQSLYDYIANLERRLMIAQTITKRF